LKLKEELMKSMLYAAMTLAFFSSIAGAQAPAAAATSADNSAAAETSIRLDTPETLLAARGTAEVLVADVDAFMEHVPQRDRSAVVSSDERVTTLLQGMLLNRQLTHEAEKNKLHENAKVQREIQLAREQVLARHAIKTFVESKPPADLEQLAREAYMADKSKFVTPEIRVVQHILVNNRERSDEDAKALIAKIETEARAPDANFDALVKKYSDDAGKAQNEGFYKIDAESEPKMDASFVAGARSVQTAGEISAPVPGMYGYHLIRLVNLQEQRQLSFDESKNALMDALRAAYNKRVEDEYVSDLRAQNPEIVTEVAQRLKTRYNQTPLAPTSKTP
jgi:parvulin-like peptidyl-prolyl isomerase